VVRIALLDDAFLGLFELEANPVEGQSLQQKDKKRRQKKGKKKIKKTKALRRRSLSHIQEKNFDFCACLSKDVIKHDVNWKEGTLSCCKCLFE